MNTDAIRAPRYRALVENTFRADAALDPALFVRGLTPDARFQLGALPAVQGRLAIEAMLTETFRAFAGVEHRLRVVYELPDRLIYEASVRYRFRDGGDAEADYVNVLQFDGERVCDYRIYLDRAGLGGTR